MKLVLGLVTCNLEEEEGKWYKWNRHDQHMPYLFDVIFELYLVEW